MTHGEFKQRAFAQFARIGQALASDRRLELLDLLAQAPRHVELLATETGMTVANVSQHLQILRAAHLVEADKEGTRTVYCLAGPDVLRLWLTLRRVAEQRLPDVRYLVAQHLDPGTVGPGFSVQTVMREADRIFLIDVRPAVEFQSGHLPGAVSLPHDQLAARLDELPRDRPIVTYCRGAFCLMADEAVAFLRERGYEAFRLEDGWLEWAASETHS